MAESKKSIFKVIKIIVIILVGLLTLHATFIYVFYELSDIAKKSRREYYRKYDGPTFTVDGVIGGQSRYKCLFKSKGEDMEEAKNKILVNTIIGVDYNRHSFLYCDDMSWFEKLFLEEGSMDVY